MPLKFPYRSGARFENRVRKELEGRGWVVFRSAGSHSPVDLVGLLPRLVALFQCRADGRMSKGERQILGALAKDLGSKAFVAYREGNNIMYQELGEEGEYVLAPTGICWTRKERDGN